eukprot:scaffold7535_cov138-Isochrysis_galbana.AAC.1
MPSHCERARRTCLPEAPANSGSTTQKSSKYAATATPKKRRATVATNCDTRLNKTEHRPINFGARIPLHLHSRVRGGKVELLGGDFAKDISPIPPVEKSRNAASHRSRNFRSA